MRPLLKMKPSMKFFKLILCCLLPLYAFTQIQVERSVFSSLGSTSSDDLVVDATLGESIIGEFANNDLVLTVGFHQTGILMTSTSFSLDDHVQIYPNPSIGRVTVLGVMPHYWFELQDLNGRIIKRFQSFSATITFDVSTLKEGIYLLKIRDQNGKIINVEKLVKIN